MQIWKGEGERFTPPAHFGGLKVADIVPFKGHNFAMQISVAPPGAGGEKHYHDDWSQVFYVIEGELTFDTGEKRFTLKAGEAVLFEPGDPHATVNEGTEDSVSIVVTVDQASTA